MSYYRDDRSTSDMLKDAGYGHRHTEYSLSTGRREIYSLETGEPVGRWTVFQADEFIKALPDERAT